MNVRKCIMVQKVASELTAGVAEEHSGLADGLITVSAGGPLLARRLHEEHHQGVPGRHLAFLQCRHLTVGMSGMGE